jgi:L-ribulose-5-phosphate 3-epimerase
MFDASVFTDEISQDFEEACRTAHEAGLRYVDIRNAWGKSCAVMDRSDWQRMAEIMQRYELRMGCIQSPFGKCDMTDEAYAVHLGYLDNLTAMAHFFGTNVIRIFPFWNPDRSNVRVRESTRQRLPEIAERLGIAARKAEAQGVYLALEPEHSTHSGTCSEIRLIIDAVSSPALAVAWDMANGWTWDEPIFPDGYERVRGLVRNVHVKERAALPVPPGQEPPPRRHMLLGQGVMPWPEIIRRLREDGYQGVFSIETHFGTRGPFGWQKLKAATTYYMYALRELLEPAMGEPSP